jgi:hypothetical protein
MPESSALLIFRGALYKFKSFLREFPGVACGFCEFHQTGNSNHLVYPWGFDAVRAIAYKGRHPTGYFFRNKDLRDVRLSERFSDYKVVDLFPLEFAFAEIAMAGDGAVYLGDLFVPNNTSDVEEHKSSTTKGTSKSAFFAPAARLMLAISYSRHILSLSLSCKEKYQLLAQVFNHELSMATHGYKSVMSNSRVCIHYQMNQRRIGTLEMTYISLHFRLTYLFVLFGMDKVATVRLLVLMLKDATPKPLLSVCFALKVAFHRLLKKTSLVY